MKFSKEFKVGNVRIYSRNKSTGTRCTWVEKLFAFKDCGEQIYRKGFKESRYEYKCRLLGTILDEVPPEISTDIEEIQLESKNIQERKRIRKQNY